MKALLLSIAGLLTFCLAKAETSANEILAEVSAKISQAESVSAKFTFESPNGNESGTLLMKANMFKLSSPSLTNIYDGEDLWSANAATGEINVFTPEDDELNEVNPITILLNSIYDFKASKISENSKNIRVSLSPKTSDSPYKKIIITIDTRTKLPESAQLMMSDGSTATFRISGINLSANIPNQRFVFKKSDFPGYKIIDLR